MQQRNDYPSEYRSRKSKQKSGYPIEHLENKRQVLKNGARLLALVGALTALFFFGALYDEGLLGFAALSGACGIFLLWSYFVTAIARVRVALYFEAEVPGDWVWSEFLARNCVYLDELATESSRLSSFGFADDMAGETVVWHTPERGLETVEQLLQKLRDRPEIMSESAAIIVDLEKMRARLQQACETGTHFCLIFHYDVVSSPEIEQRQGSF